MDVLKGSTSVNNNAVSKSINKNAIIKNKITYLK